MRLKRALVVMAAAGLLAAACGGDDKGAPAEHHHSGRSGGPPPRRRATTKTPVTGGTLTFGSYSKISGLDPIVGLGQGTSGGIPMAALYDSIVRFNQTDEQVRDAHRRVGHAERRLHSSGRSNSRPASSSPTAPTMTPRRSVRYEPAPCRHRHPAAECATWYACPRNPMSSSAYMSLVKDIVVVDNDREVHADRAVDSRLLHLRPKPQ